MYHILHILTTYSSLVLSLHDSSSISMALKSYQCLCRLAGRTAYSLSFTTTNIL
ncbi:hypothetical protein M404DRAFT_730436 [Pisolithus tinctorius Marx 270]|uniref:Uncharacterized protein n=1 Tax=Pisolithus tinctorius Marx 270 TaxID=870435 RepID=A0A0C3IX29_PISTI|nr:hypothetical protein M404DRAFT_730436 [Pisolithus tinctorius Marx 270]